MKCFIKQDYGGAVEDLEGDVKPILNLYADGVDDVIDNPDDNGAEKDAWFGLKSEVCFCEQSGINSI